MNGSYEFEIPEFNRLIKYRTSGDIVHFTLDKKEFIFRQKYTNKAIKSMKKFVERSKNPSLHNIAAFNSVSGKLISEYEYITPIEIDHKGSILCELSKTKGVYHILGQKLSQNYTQRNFNPHHKSEFGKNIRYSVLVFDNGLELEPYENIILENLNKQYSDPILSIYTF